MDDVLLSANEETAAHEDVELHRGTLEAEAHRTERSSLPIQDFTQGGQFQDAADGQSRRMIRPQQLIPWERPE